MSQILEKLHKVDPNDSDAVKEIITGFFQNVTKHTEVNCNVWLRGLEKVITRFPRYCTQHRTTIEKYLVHFLDAPNLYNVIEAAKCAHALQQIRPSQDKGATAKNCWREQMSVLCEAAHRLMDVVFSSAGHPHGDNHYVKTASYPLLGDGPLATALSEPAALNGNVRDRSSQLLTKLRNIFVFIQAMLVEVYPVGKPVAPRPLLELAVRALGAPHAGHSGHAVSTDVASLKVHALRTLDALVACLGSNLIPYSALVVRCAMQTLRWSSEHPGEDASRVRCAAYASLCVWVGVSGGGSSGGAWHEQLCGHVARDITPHAHTLHLTMNSQYGRKLSKKARRKLTNSQLQQSALHTHAPGINIAPIQIGAGSEQVCVAALECVELFLTECGDTLRPALLAMLQERLVRAGYALVAGTGGESERRAMSVLRALRAARATHHLLQLCAALRHSACHQIRKFCSQTLLELKLQLHGSPPSLSFALDLPSDNNHSASKALRMSRKNRAALESLLGKERCDASLMKSSSDEVITIADGPSIKRPRLESQVISDNISVSSDSVESLGSTDDDDDVIVDNERDSNQLTQNGADAKANVITNNVEGGEHISERVEENNVDDAANTSQAAVESEQTQVELTSKTDIYEAKTQIPLNISTDQDTVDDDESPLSMEIVYDPNTVNKVTVLERIEDDTLPSTNDTDDVQITCGQVMTSSQDLNIEVNKTSEEIPKVNGVSDAVVANTEHDDEVIENIKVKINTKEMTVDDMLADFVDEPIEEATVEA